METPATREVYFGITSVWIMYALLVPTLAVFGYGLYRRAGRWTLGRPIARTDRLPERLRRLAEYVLAQRTVVRDRIGGIAHVFLFWSMVFLFAGTCVVFVHEDLQIRIMQSAFYLYFQSLLLNLAGGLGTLALGAGAVYRYLVRPARLHLSRAAAQSAGDDGLALLWLFVIFVQGFLISGLRIAATHDPYAGYRFIANWLAELFVVVGMGEPLMATSHHVLWWVHLVTVFGWIAWLPYSKMVHLVTTPLAVFFGDLEARGAARSASDLEGRGPGGLLDNFTWKDLLDLDACTECGRCQDVCPAYAAGAPLSPRNLILDLRSTAHCPRAQQAAPLLPTAAWACTTCRACEATCPIAIEHVAKVVEVRRWSVEGEGPSPTLSKALESLASLGNPHRLPPSERPAFLEKLDVPIVGPAGTPEVVLWLGCSGAYVPSAQEATVALVKILKAAGVDFAILGASERCCGDPARRTGEEGLFQELAQANIATLQGLGVKKLLTSCAHCYHTLKHEYAELGGTFAVVHHADLIRDLIADGRIGLSRPLDQALTYHDPCYLGRYNGIYDAPRESLQKVTTGGLRELPRTREQSVCCGGGGGQMYLESVAGTRVNRVRFAEVEALDVPVLATACPYCKIMLNDAAQYDGSGPKPRVRDIAELVWEAMGR